MNRKVKLVRQSDEPQVPDDVKFYIDKELNRRSLNLADIVIPLLSVVIELAEDHFIMTEYLDTLSANAVNNETYVLGEGLGAQETNKFLKDFAWMPRIFHSDNSSFVSLVDTAKKVYGDLPEGNDKTTLAMLLIKAERRGNSSRTTNLNDDQIIDYILADAQVENE